MPAYFFGGNDNATGLGDCGSSSDFARILLADAPKRNRVTIAASPAKRLPI